MADIQSTAAEIRRGKKKEEEDRRRRRKKLQGKNIMAPLLHRAAIISQNFSSVVDYKGQGRLTRLTDTVRMSPKAVWR